MIRLTLHQIWNQRHQNLWIWLELSLLSAFLWIVIDPLFTRVCITQVPRGYNQEGLYIITPVRNKKINCFEQKNYIPQMDNLLTQLNAHPMVESVCLCVVNSLPGMPGTYYSRFYHDREAAGTDVETVWYDRANGLGTSYFAIPYEEGLEKWTDLPGVLGLRDAITGHPVHGCTDAEVKSYAYLSAGMARQLYGTVNAQDSSLFFLRDRNVYMGTETDEIHVRVKAVCSNIKMHDYETPSPTLLVPTDDIFFTTCPLVRLKKGVNEDDFKASVEHDVQPRCTMDYLTRYEVKSLADMSRKANERSGMYNTMRLRSAMSFFGLLCVFLGVSGLFWVRCNERRQDIGIMRSMGASRKDICRQMLTEATLLLTMAFLPALLYVLWHVHANGYDIGMAESSLSGKADMAYWFNRPVPHVLAVTIITYTTMLLITLLATWLPVQRASRILPSDALRDE